MRRPPRLSALELVLMLIGLTSLLLVASTFLMSHLL
jgi:hypothetical protein